MHAHPYPESPHRVESYPPGTDSHTTERNILEAFLSGRMVANVYMRLADFLKDK
jgi:hypothetical protein